MNIGFNINHRSQRFTVLRQCRDVLAYKRDERKIMIPIDEIYFCKMLYYYHWYSHRNNNTNTVYIICRMNIDF